MEKSTIELIFLAIFIFSIGGFFSILLMHGFINRPRLKSNRQKQYEIDVKENADFPTAVEEDFIPTNFDEEILNSWEKLNSHKASSNKISLYSKVALFDFAEHYHKAKS